MTYLHEEVGGGINIATFDFENGARLQERLEIVVNIAETRLIKRRLDYASGYRFCNTRETSAFITYVIFRIFHYSIIILTLFTLRNFCLMQQLQQRVCILE